MLTHDRLQRPGQSTTRQPGPRLGRAAGVLAPTPGAPLPADRHQQGGRWPAQRLVRQLPRDGVPGASCTPAASAPAISAVIGLQDPARQDRAIGLQTLAEHDQVELIQAAERGQVRAAEGSVRHVEVFQTA